MRIWDVSPGVLCRAHLLGEHRELHAVRAVIGRRTRGYAQHPETRRWVGKLPALARRHRAVAAELRARGYRHASPMRAASGATVQRTRLLPAREQLARLAAKPCDCPRPVAARTGRR